MSTDRFPLLQGDNDRTALIDGERRVTYGALNGLANRLATGLLGSKEDLEEERIAFFLPASTDYVAVMHAVWRAAAKRTTADGATDPLIASTAMAAAMTMAQSRMMASPANRWRIYKILSALMIAPYRSPLATGHRSGRFRQEGLSQPMA